MLPHPSHPLPIVLAAVLSIFPSPSHGDTRDTLIHMNPAQVLVESLSKEFEEIGLSEKRIRTDVELKLRLAGLRVSDDADCYLYVNVTNVKTDNLFAYSISIEARQQALLRAEAFLNLKWAEDRKAAMLFWQDFGEGEGQLDTEFLFNLSFSEVVTTWRRGVTGVIGVSKNPRKTIRDAVKDLTDEFLNEYLAEKQQREQAEEALRRLEAERAEPPGHQD